MSVNADTLKILANLGSLVNYNAVTHAAENLAKARQRNDDGKYNFEACKKAHEEFWNAVQNSFAEAEWAEN